MQWGSPLSFLLLLAAVPFILFLHSLKPKGTKIRTTALFLWERVLRERPVGKRIGWLLRKNLLLILQILIAAILIMALADPSLRRFGVATGDAVVVMDMSASMKAAGRAGTRFDEARKELLSLIDAMPSDQKMMVIGAGPIPRILSPFTADEKRLKDLARSLQPTDAPGQVKEAILLAHSFLKQESRDRVVALSDGAFDGAEELPWHSSHLRLVRAQGKSENVGITGFEFRRVPNSARDYEIMVRAKNFTLRPLRAPLTLTIGEKKWIEERIELAPQESRVLIYPYRGALGKRATVSLGIEDDFPTDNRAFLTLAESLPIRLLYVGKGNSYLEPLFRSFSDVQVTRVDRVATDFSSSRHSDFDVILLDGVPSPPLARGNFILINTIGEGLPVHAAGKMRDPRPVPSVAHHPLTEGVRLDDLRIREASHLIPTGGGVVLARSQEGPLIFAYEKGRLRVLLFGFDLLASDLPLRVAFPVLLHNAFDWFQPKRVEFPATKIQAGKPYLLHLHETEDQVEVLSPSGRREILKAASNPLPFTDTSEAGFYTFKTGSREGEFAVNLLSESESQISPRVHAQEAAGEKGETGERAEARLSLWPFFLVAVFALLLLEGFLALRSGGFFYPLLFRLLSLLALGFALFNPRIFRDTDALDVVLGVDFSRSVGQEGKEKALDILEEARRNNRPDTRVGLLFFGRQPAWEFFPRSQPDLADLSPQVAREETDIETALQAALAQVGEGRQGKVLLISDGNENRGEASRAIPLLRSHGVPVWVLPISLSRGRNEVYLSDLLLPHQVDSAEGFEVKGAIESLRDAPVRVRLLRNGTIQREEALTLKRGTNWVGFKQSLKDQGSHTFELLIESPEDTLPENNRLQGVVEVRGPPRVLYLYSRGDSQRFMARVIRVQGYSVAESLAQEASLSLPEISTFDLLVLDNVPAYQLSQAKMETIERYVRDLGGGLVVIGGPQSYGAGGYYSTPLERILPVEMRPPSRLDLPHVALLFVLDKSGSMGAGPPGATKLDLAKGAALAAADLLNPSDQVGILAFDAGWDWVLPFRQVGKGEWISEGLASVQSDGGTDLYKAMVEAHRVFSAKAAAIKHLLVLSDGLTDKADFESLAKKMVREGITVSTVALGQDADVALMYEIAKTGKGRTYVTVDPKTIPQIFTTETLLISRDLLVEKPVNPQVVSSAGPLKGFARKKFPLLRGYVLTHPKPRADLLMKAEEDPLLVSWRYGLGTVSAFTSDLSGRWGKEWASWEDFPQWAGQLTRSSMRKMPDHRIRTELKQEGEEVKAIVDFVSKEGGFVNHLKLRGNLAGPHQTTHVSSFQQIAPGRYETSFSASQRGVYFLTIHDEGEKGETPAAVTVPFIAPYPKEYRELKPNTALLSRLAEETGGETLDPDKMEEGLKRLFTPDPKKGRSVQETWWPLSGLGLFLFLADLALRRWPGIQRP
ncbi:MAG: VWA domain-containing protein [Deltaproteobacteria bacterium]|nr:VWA domain-containing protein [Deltaproteobacteria bacterium]